MKRLRALLTGKDQPDLFQRWNKNQYHERQRGIIYCRKKDDIQEVCQYLTKLNIGLRIEGYHADLDKHQRQTIYERFIRDDADGLDIIVATKAFGMGIDVRRLGFVIHFDIPPTPEAYYQEAGRAGRDAFFQREKAQCILLYHKQDIETQRYLLKQNLSTLIALKPCITPYTREGTRNKRNTYHSQRDRAAIWHRREGHRYLSLLFATT